MTSFFTEAFNSLPPEEMEAFYRTIFLQMDTPFAADIGEGSVVGSGSVVVKTIPPYSVAVGVPARVMRQRGEPKGPS